LAALATKGINQADYKTLLEIRSVIIKGYTSDKTALLLLKTYIMLKNLNYSGGGGKYLVRWW